MSEQNISFINNFDELTKAIEANDPPTWLKELRSKNLLRFRELGMPSVKDEEWKYTNIAPILERKYKVASAGKLKEERAFAEYCEGDTIRIVFINGVFSKEDSRLSGLPKGLTILPLKEAVKNNGAAIESALKKYSTAQSTSFVALNVALTDNGVYIKLDNNTVIESAIHIAYVTSSANGEMLSLPRSIIDIRKSSEATVLESHLSFDDSITYFSNALTDIYLSENATLHYCKAQKESLKAFHINNTRVWQEANSNLDSATITVGGAITRNNLDIVLSAEGISSILNGLYSVYGDQHVDNHTSVDHRFPNCVSNQLYKGVLNGSARAVFNGKIFVRPIAQKTNSYQLNKNLLLGKDCRIDTKPQLEIFADDVKCTHGATIGQLNEDEIFYLQTRGIKKSIATKMLARGFVDDLIDTVKSDPIKQKLHLLLEPSFAQF